MKQFKDEYGNMLPNSWDIQSENPTTFNAAYFFSEYLKSDENNRSKVETGNRIAAKYFTNGDSWRTMEYDKNPDWSIDEKISALAFFNFNNSRIWIKRVPLFPSLNNSSFFSWLRPDVVAYTLKVKYPWLPLLDWIIGLKIYSSLKQFEKDPAGESSGVQLAFIKLMGMKAFDTIEKYDSVWKRAFDIYYPEPEHPTRELWK